MNKIVSFLIVIFFTLTATAATDGSRPGIIPKPVKQVFGEGEFLFGTTTRYDMAVGNPAEIMDYIQSRLGELSAFLAPVEGEHNSIIVRIDSLVPVPAEGYALSVEPERITIRAGDHAGVVYGIETLMQLINPEQHIAAGKVAPAVIPCQTITDYPRFPYRGMHLDVARTFSDKATVMRYIDNMARHKFNKFHWHLADDEGWRIEIKSYPRLTSVGAFRGGGLPLKHTYGEWDRQYGGYFTQEDIREIVAFAALRGIEIIPEIDLPGHSRAAAKAYPEILCGGQFDTIPSRDDRRNVWCASKESNFEMLDKILGEVAALFPSEYIHVGGDEVDPQQWEACPECGAIVERFTPDYLNGRFMNRLNAILAKHGKKQAVWNEAMNGGNLDKDAVVWGWENVEACRKALKEGYKTVLMPAQYFYFDMRQDDGEPGMTWAGTVPLKKVYTFEPESVGITPAEMKNVIGIEGAFWTEKLLEYTPEYLDYQTYPRMCALAELLWTPKASRNWDDFRKRLTNSHYPRLKAWGIAFRIDPPVEKREGSDIVITPPFPGITIYYTADGTKPDRKSLSGEEVRINADDKRTYRFNARYGAAASRTVYLKDYKEPLITPKCKLTSSLQSDLEYPFANASDYNSRTGARTTMTCTAGDWFMWRFSEPVDASEITLKTGANHMRRWVISSGYVEVSYDGETFEMIEPEFHAEGVIRPEPGLRAIRITATSDDNGENMVIIQDLKLLR